MANGYPNGSEYEDEGWWEDIYTDPVTVPDPIVDQPVDPPITTTTPGGTPIPDWDSERVRWKTPDDFQQFFDWAHHGAPTGYPGLGPTWQQHYGQFSDPSQARWDSPAFNWENEPTELNQALTWLGGSRNRANPLAGIPQHELRNPGIDPTDQAQADWAKKGLEQLQDAYDTYRQHRVDNAVGTWHRDNPWASLQNRWNQMGTAWDQARQARIDERNAGLDDNEAARLACIAKGDGSTWDGTKCVPPQGPGEDLGAACRAKGWNWDGANCTPPTQPTITSGEQDCINNGGTWTGTACDYRYTPGYDPTTGTPIDTTLPRFNDDPTDASFTPTNTLPPDWLNALYPHQDEIPFLPQEFEDMTRVDVGADPLSQMTNKILANLGTTGGVAYTPLAGAVENRLISTLENEGQGPLSPLQAQVLNNLGDVITNRGEIYDPQRDAMEIEAIRSPLDTLRQSQLAEGQAAMAGRGMLGSGPEADYMQRLERSLAPQYTTAAQRLEIDRRNRRDDRLEKAMELSARTENEREILRTNRLNTALSEATGMSEEQSRNLLNTAKTVTERQQMLNDIAIQSLDRNMEWNKFLAEHQLKRHEVIEAIQEGRFSAILPLLQAYMTGASIAGTGFTRPTDDTSKRTTGDK